MEKGRCECRTYRRGGSLIIFPNFSPLNLQKIKFPIFTHPHYYVNNEGATVKYKRHPILGSTALLRQ